MSSSIPGAVAYWVNLATTTLQSTATSPNGVYVWFGTPLSKYIAPITLQVMSVVDITHEWAELGSAYKIEEHYKIRNQLVSYAGGTDFMGRMNEVFSNFEILSIATANDYTLGSNVRLCLPLVEGEYMPGTDASGKTMGSLMFDLHCEARITSLT
jgi:hypothetical protein